MTTPNFTRGIGRLAVDRFEYQQHINGSGDRHNATEIDVANPSLVYGNAVNVEAALEDINNFIILQINAGQGFVTVGDGYDTYHNQNGTINYDPTIPSLDALLNPIFTDILNGTPVPANFSRIQHGGVILIKAGTYIVKKTISVPPGITLLGEGYGTKIVNATSLDFSGSPPPVPLKGSPTPAAIFSIIADGYRSFNDGAVDPNLFIFSRQTAILNMVIADNFVEPTLLGDTFYKLPQNSTSTTALNPPPLVSQQVGSNLLLSGIMGLGRVNFSSGKIVSRCTGTFLGLDTSSTNTETFSQIFNCFFDGFSIPINLSSTSASDGYGQDFLEVRGCKMRSYGYFNGDSTDGYANTTIKCDVQNVSITNSLFYGNATNITSLLFLTYPPSAPAKQDRSKIIVTDNQVIINKTSSDNSTNATWIPIHFSSNIATPSTYLTSLVYGNDFQDTFDVYVDDGYQFSTPGLGGAQLSINRATKTTTLRNDIVTVDGYVTNLVGNVIVTGTATIPQLLGTTVLAGLSAQLTVPSTASIQITGAEFIQPGGELVIGGAPGNTALFNPDIYSISKFNQSKILFVPITVTSGTYTVDSGTIFPGFDSIIMVSFTSSAPVTITLPTPVAGRYLIIKDIGNASANHITINPISGNIDSGSALLIITTFGYAALISDGLQWYTIGKLGT